MTNTLVRAGMTPAVRCRYVADLIEANPDHFDMDYFLRAWDEDGEACDGEVRLLTGERPDITACGTACCIAGWAIAVTPPSEVCGEDAWDASDAAAPLLAIAERDAEGLFYARGLKSAEAAFLLRWHADELDRADD